MRLTTTFLIGVLVLAGCEKGSELAPEPLSNMDRKDRVSYARSLPIKERISLYVKVYNSRRHPPDTIIADAFANEQNSAFLEITVKIKSYDDFIMYLPIVLSIDSSEYADACQPEILSTLRDIANRFPESDSGLANVEFENCTLLRPPGVVRREALGTTGKPPLADK